MKIKFYPLYFFCILAAGLLIVFVQGCGIISILGSEPESTKKIPAEFKFDVSKDKKDKKVLVLVNQPSWLNAPPLLQQMITEQIQKRLMLYAGLKNFNLISYEALSQYRSGEENYSSMTAPQIGTALGADWVLLADLTDFKFGSIGESEYYSGSLSGHAFVIETANSEKLWPEDAENKKIDVGFEASKDGPQGSLAHLAAAFAHCATRNFFDCPKSSFKIAEDRIASSLNEWGN
jgi:hypothetical protein